MNGQLDDMGERLAQIEGALGVPRKHTKPTQGD